MDTILSIPNSVVVWQFGGKPGNLRSQNQYSTDNGGNGYNMLCQSNNQFLTYKDTSAGINLDFTTDSNLHKTHFRVPDGAEREILTGDKVALGIGGGKAFLRYDHRTVGINLDWFGDPTSENDPSFQWRIYGATSEKGKPIPTNSWVALLNENVSPIPDFLIRFPRPGGDIGWTSSPGWTDRIKGWLTSDAFKALVAILV